MASRRKAGRGENDQAAYLKEKINDTEKLVDALKIGIADITAKLETMMDSMGSLGDRFYSIASEGTELSLIHI